MILNHAKALMVGSRQVSRVYRGAEIVWGGNVLPAGYRAAKCLESDGGQGLNIGIFNVPNVCYDIDIAITQITGGTRWIFGRVGTPYTTGLTLHVLPDGHIYGAQSGAHSLILPADGYNIGQRLRIVAENGISYVDGIEVGNVNNDGSTTYTVRWLPLFGRAYGGAASVPSSGQPCRIYHCRFYTEDGDLADLYPCIRTEDGKPGMYDIVRDKFYTNIGTDEFAYE